MPKQDKNIAEQIEQEALESTQESQEATHKTQKKGFFSKTLEKAKESTQEFFSTDSSEAESSNEAKKAGFNTPSLKSITKKYSLVNCLAFQYIGQYEFNIRVGSASYTFSTGEVVIVPNDSTAQWLKHKNTLFVAIS